MEHYNIYFEVASVVFLIMMIILLKTKRQLDIFKNRLFSRVVQLMLLLNLLDIVTSIMVNHVNRTEESRIPIVVLYAFTMLGFVLQQIVLLVFLVYAMSIFTPDERKQIGYIGLLFLSILYILLIFSTPVTHEVFWFDESLRYTYGRLYKVTVIMPVLSLLYGLWIVNRGKYRFSKRILRGFYGCIVLSGFVGILQFLFFRDQLVVYFCFTLLLVSVFFTIQSPDYYLDQSTNAFNNDGLRIMMKDRIDRKTKFAVLLMSVYDFEGLKGGFSPQNKRKVYQRLCAGLIHRPKKERKQMKMDVFRDDDKFFVMFHNTEEAERYAMKIGSWVTDGIYLDEANPKVKIVATMLLFDVPGRAQTEEEFHSVIKYFMTDTYYKKYNVMQTINEEFYRKKKRYDDVRHLVEEAIRTEGIEMYYQPIYSALQEDFHSAEALVRLRDTNSIGFVSPEEFIPIAEKEHLILQLEEVILRKTFQFIQRARLRDYGVQYVELNLSGNQCMQQDLADQLKKLIREYNIPANFINFEVTETSTIENSDNLIRNMVELQRCGSTFALDDYGSGASNLKYLVDYPFQIVKLDKSIVWAHFGGTNPKTRAVLPYSVRMLGEMKVCIVAEGVETEEQKDELIRLGVHYLQGYYFSKPLSEEDYLKFLKENNRINP